MKGRAWPLVACYLGAIVAANLLVAAFGQAALVVTALLLIPFDLFSRDLLHERWEGTGLVVRMGSLVLAGSVLSFLANTGSWRVSIASCVSFGIAAGVDWLVYARLEHRTREVRMVASNSVAAVVDSVAFPLIAFGSVTFWLSGTQSVAKIAGGLAWVYALRVVRDRR